MLKKIFLSILICIFAVNGVFSSAVFAENSVAFYVSPLGDDTNAGTLESPFKTIERARQEVQKYTPNMSEDIYVYIRGGNYFVDKTITFTEHDSGTNGYTVHYKNYADEKPVIYGGKRIEGWEHWQNGIYKTELPEGTEFYALTEDLEWSNEACYPNDGYLDVAKQGTSDGRNTVLYFKDGDVLESVNASGLRVKSFPYLHYASATWPVTEINQEQNYILMNSFGETNSTAWTEEEGLYRLIGDISFLDTPGEFYLDKEENILYYYPRSEDISKSIIVAPEVKRLFSFTGSGVATLTENIAIEGLTLSTTDFAKSFHQGDLAGDVAGSDAMVKIENARNITISNCRLLNAGINAIWLEGLAQNNTISGNFIKNAGYIGVLMSGYTAREAMGRFDSLEDGYCNKNNTVFNNYIRRVGINAGHGAGIQIYQSGDNVITHNEISHSPRYGISLKGESHPGGIRAWGIDVQNSDFWLYDSKSMIYDLRFSQNNYIAYNDLYDCMKETRDGGIFETNSAGRGNVFENNLVHDTASADKHGMFFGIYIDGSSVNWRVEKNVVYNLSSQGGGCAIMINPGIYNQVQNNIIDGFNGNADGVTIVGRNTVFNKNILYSPEYTSIGGSGLSNLVSMENNLYYSGTGEYRVVGAEGEDTIASWQSQGVYDQNSVVGQLPGFTDAANHDYTLEDNSPAAALGIENAAVSAGLTDSFTWERENNVFPDMIVEDEDDSIDAIVDPTGSLRLECESAEYFNSVSPGTNYIGGVSTVSYLGFYGVDLTDVTKMTVRYAVPASYAGHKVVFRLDDRNSGEILGSFITEATDGWMDFTTTTFQTADIDGKHTVYMVFPEKLSGYGNFDWVRFETDTGVIPEKDTISGAANPGEGTIEDFGDIAPVVNGEFLYNCGAYLLNENIMVPLEETVSSLGFSHDAESNTITDTEGNKLIYTVESSNILINNNDMQLPCNVTADENGKVYLPAEVFELAFQDCVMYSPISGYLRIFDVNRADLLANPDNPDSDLAWRKSAIASSSLENRPSAVMDNDASTVWRPFYANREWICIDLGSRSTFDTIQIEWGDRYARAFEVYVSDSFAPADDNVKPIYSYYTFEGGTWSKQFEPITARYVFIYLKCMGGVRAPSVKDIHIYNNQ